MNIKLILYSVNLTANNNHSYHRVSRLPSYVHFLPLLSLLTPAMFYTCVCSLAEVSDSASEGEEQLGGRPNHPTYAEEQEQLKESFKGAVVEMEREEEGEGGEILTLRKKTKQEQVR